MNVGYVRLSRDDDGQNYVSIENQKLIISQFAAENRLAIDRWYEDDGISGYQFNRPGFNQLMEDLDNDIDRVFVKDFSRLGRHNAKVLLLLDDFKERGKQLIVVDDNYDSLREEDDTIGIKTWYNERYVKDTSKKIKRALLARQKEGTLITQPPFGYRRDKTDKLKFEIISKEAEYIRSVYDLYLQGFGYRRIAEHLTEQKIPTPSMIRHEHELEEGKLTKRRIAAIWSSSMVKEILDNDFYAGTLRLRKRARSTVHGKDRRVPRDEQYVFEDNHPAIVDKASFALVQDLKSKRMKSNYRGSRGKWHPSEIPNPFGSCLFCKDCGSRLTPIRRCSSGKENKYYICTVYNTKGKRFCPKSHLIRENDLKEDIIAILKLCRDSLWKEIAAYDIKNPDTKQQTAREKCSELQSGIDNCRKQLKTLLARKIKDLSAGSPVDQNIIAESYDALQKDILTQLHGLEQQLMELSSSTAYPADQTLPRSASQLIEERGQPMDGLQILDAIIEKKELDRKDIEILIERIEVDQYGFPEIKLRYRLAGLLPDVARRITTCYKENRHIEKNRHL